ncbi:amidohydrolase [Candidatus Roizmanbacteria bacterium]|nr:amidohydrolase [Candidatus Roizmanbacteria bacterium]
MDDATNLIQFKNHFDSHPELAWEEFKTQEYIISQLGTDYVWRDKTALIYKQGAGPAVYFRTELDALNTIHGPKHVCGHAGHMAALMGAYLYFKENPPVAHTIYFVFQPSEEAFPSGAKYLEEHVPELSQCLLGIAFHTYPSAQIGEIMDVHMAAGDYFEITIQGKSTHIKNKNDTTTKDALISASRIIRALNEKKYKKFIVNGGTLSGGETPNSIAGQAIIKGDIRSLEEIDRDRAYKWLMHIVEAEKTRSKLEISVFYSRYYPVLKNDKKFLRRFQTLLPISKKITSFATEDFSLYPGKKLFLFVGTGEDTDLHEINFEVSQKLVNRLVEYWIIVGTNLKKLLK